MSSVDAIVPCYNYGRFLDRCVRSILDQASVDVRVLIVDDCSSDDSESVGRRLAAADGRVEYRRHRINHGHIATYNEGLEWSKADYSLILSADDLLTPGALRRITALMDAHSEVSLGFGRDVTFEHEPPPFDECETPALSKIFSYDAFIDRSCELGFTPLTAPASVARLSVHLRVGGYLPLHPHSGDTEVWLRLASQGNVGYIDAIQAFRRVHGGNMSFDYSPLKRLREHRRAFDAHFDLGFGGPSRIEVWRRKLYGTLAEQAFWLGSRAFDADQDAFCRECLLFAADLSPEIVRSTAWHRFRYKRLIDRATFGSIRRVPRSRTGRD